MDTISRKSLFSSSKGKNPIAHGMKIVVNLMILCFVYILDTAAPSVVISPERRMDRIFTSATFKCTVHGKPPFEILWSRIDGRPLPKRAVIAETGENSKTIVINRLELTDSETYICSGRNDYGLSTAKAPLVVVGK